MKKYIYYLFCVLLVLLLSSDRPTGLATLFEPVTTGGAGESGGSSKEIRAGAESSREFQESVSDGPYVFRDGNYAEVYYVHKGDAFRARVRKKRESFSFNIKPFRRSYRVSALPPQIGPDDIRGVEKIFVISDIHGQYHLFEDLMKGAGIVTSRMHWNWGEGHLVILGDIFDRGEEVTEILWCIYRLQQEAKRKGGMVHYLLGNHELMILRNNHRYLHPKYKYVGERIPGKNFRQLFLRGTILGDWLRSCNTIMRINDMLFVHGGIHPGLLKMNLSINRINRVIRRNLDRPQEEIKANDMLNFLFRGEGPLWYRGYFAPGKQYPQAKSVQVYDILKKFKAKHIVVGHTTQEHVSTRHDNRVIAVDGGLKFGKKGRGEALYWEKGRFYRVGANTKQRLF
ncbi:MAG: metallophosphoesterase [bacterium]|nr:metallophosphoesterase [bacterium]